MNAEHDISIDLFNKAPFGYLITMENGTIIRINDALLKLLHMSREEIVGKKRFQDLITMGGRIYYDTHYFPLLIHQKEIQEINFEIQSDLGEKIPVLVNTSVIEKEPGQLTLLSTIMDISQRKLYEQELFLAKKDALAISTKLEEANKELEQFSHVLSHDLKSPIINIVNILALFEKSTLSEERSEMYMKLIKNSANSLLEMINGVLQYHINSDIGRQTPERIETLTLVKKVAQIADPESKVEMKVNIEEKTILTFPIVIEMILLNLMVNAIKYNDEETVQLELAISSDEVHYHFSISDNGRGIDLEDHDRIFEPSQTLALKDRFNKQGTGLGLSYVKKMVEKLGGAIKVQSKLGHGSTFSFTILKSFGKDILA
jgi:PAS domain S-box-containing protein